MEINCNNDWSGRWTGKYGINSKEDFLNNTTVQNIAISEYHQKVWGYIKEYHPYENMEIKGAKLCKAGMLACAHLVGHEEFKKFIKSNGTIDPKDGNEVPCSVYLKVFENYTIDYDINQLKEKLKK